MKLNKLAVAVALVAASAGANAGWDFGVAATQPTDGELLLTLWNSNLETSVAIDLGGSVASFLNGTAEAQSFALDAQDLAHVGGAAAASDIRWSLIGSSSLVTNPASIPGWGLYYTSNATPSETFNSTDFGTQLGLLTNKAPIWTNNDTTEGSVNNSYLKSGGTTYAGFGAVYGDTSGGLVTAFGAQSGSAAAAETLNAWVSNMADGFTSNSVNTMDLNIWKLDLASGSLEYQAVPVPAAAWLFGSALLGMAGVARRKKSA